MTWIAPEVSRTDAPIVAPERAALDGWLEFHRQTLLLKCQGLTGEQLAQRAVAPSSMSLLGLVRHMAEVERAWFSRRFGGQPDLAWLHGSREQPDNDFDFAEPDGAEEDFAAFARECEMSRQAAEGHSLDETFKHPDGEVIDLRWVYLHMIEEYARHNGHADILREQIDGTVGS
jgi:uncharacterized damage-inducible protein DinB